MKCIVRPQFYLHHEGKVFCPGEIVEWPKDRPLPAPLQKYVKPKNNSETAPESAAQATETPETDVTAGLPLQPAPEKDE